MAHPLELSYNWRLPVMLSTVGLFVTLSVLLRGRADGWLPVVIIVVLIWAGFVTLVWLRTRASIMVDGSRLQVRHFKDFHDIDGAQVTAVTQFLTPHGPSYRLTVVDATGTRRRTVPSALLRGGHSTLFAWILAWAPQASLDKGSLKTLEQLRIRGLIQ